MSSRCKRKLSGLFVSSRCKRKLSGVRVANANYRFIREFALQTQTIKILFKITFFAELLRGSNFKNTTKEKLMGNVSCLFLPNYTLIKSYVIFLV